MASLAGSSAAGRLPGGVSGRRWARAGRWLLLPVVLAAGLAGLWPPRRPAGRAPQTLVIRRGGTYSGTFRSPDSRVPCVRIATTEPVVLTSCVLTGAGDLILADLPGARLTVRNCRGYGLRPSRDQTRRGRFLDVNAGRSVRVEHNYFAQTSGISIYQWSGDGTPGQTLTVRCNQARNLDGRFRDGGEEFCNFLGLNQVLALENLEVAWNEVINEPDRSLVADNINFFNSGGTRRCPARIHDNYIRGAYPLPATAPDYAGSGITLDGDGRAALSATAYVEAYANQVVSTGNAAMNIAAGHDNRFHDNRLVTCGQLPDGRALRSAHAATAVWNAYRQPPSVFTRNAVADNIIGFAHWGEAAAPTRQDLSPGHCTPCTGTRHLPGPLTLATEHAEWRRWQAKLAAHQLRAGPE